MHTLLYIWVDQYKFIDNGSNTFNNNHNNKRTVLKTFLNNYYRKRVFYNDTINIWILNVKGF